ncbi:MAG: hypothetical protein ABIZ80_26065 [Bryobacteraceae bacterium]
MKTTVSRRSLLACAGAAAVPPPISAGIKLGMATGTSEEMLRFLKQLGVEWLATSLRATQGATIDPAVTRGAVLTSIDGAGGGIGGPPGGPSGPWKEEEVRQVIRRVEAGGLRLWNLMMHGFPNVILGNA